nr:immunoglobulin heavy chain junction region [Macaca mulatta]MOV36131.1 immunoglobulin heavy chain junction region [Macaca mulatta]MOV36273.1 immunoglobulin heavy chain junction region [Macaca mulatta]MOV36299.1 immunoglobulin heavy chain junction region [Macaca mulatta]MOV36327.1 immunoglobulin heavy chain junction region [Macaca mulatta]
CARVMGVQLIYFDFW